MLDILISIAHLSVIALVIFICYCNHKILEVQDEQIKSLQKDMLRMAEITGDLANEIRIIKGGAEPGVCSASKVNVLK
jgi:hypothetical protein